MKPKIDTTLALFGIYIVCMLAVIWIFNVKVDAEDVIESSETTIITQVKLTIINTPTPTSTPTPTPTPTVPPDLAYVQLDEELTPQGRYELALENGEIDGPMKKHIAKYPGGFMGPSGRETYYNLKMGVVVKNMRKLGYSEKDYPYWVRDDGAKMLGNYVMVAANWKIRPRGTILKTSLGSAIVVDTGEFVKDYPKGVDIATNW